MANEKTLIILKPNSVKKNVIGAILQKFETVGLAIVGSRMEQLTKDTCEAFYAEHHGRPFYDGLVEFMTSGPVLLLVLSGDEAIARAREIMGTTDPSKAEPGTIRAEFADNMTENAVHGSDSATSAEREIAFFFTHGQICERS